MNNKIFKLHSPYNPAGDQPQAIKELLEGLADNKHDQVLLGVTGSGKTFTMANVIANSNRPALIMAHNKTLAAQLYSEMKEFFPENAVEYFVSYYDYYQPEAYIPRTDTFIEKDSAINEQIDLLRHSATRSLIERRDVIVVSSVSCIYGLGSPELYLQMTIPLKKGQHIDTNDLAKQLVNLQYERHDMDFQRGSFRIKGDTFDIFPSHYDNRAWRLSFFGDEIEEIYEIDSLTSEKYQKLEEITIFANSHYVTPRPTLQQAIILVKEELKQRIKYFEENNKLIEAQRINERTKFDLEMIQETNHCKGIENYSRYLSGRKPGQHPPTLFEYLHKDTILFVDESHVTIPQIGGMYNGDRARKSTLVEFGFRLPSALDNRPMKFEEWDALRPDTIYVSATPGKYELELTQGEIVEQVIRPTGLIDPECIIRPAETQVDDLLNECKKTIALGLRVLVTTLTKKMAEDLSTYMQEIGIKVTYLHSDIDTLDRVEIIRELRKGTYDILVGVNLLREGIDIPECGLMAIMDADKEGFLRSQTSLIQLIGRAARNQEGKVILYADVMTKSIKAALSETERRREKQIAYNTQHGITPKTIYKAISEALKKEESKDLDSNETDLKQIKDLKKYIAKLHKEMLAHAQNLEFEKAAKIRDEISRLEALDLGLKNNT